MRKVFAIFTGIVLGLTTLFWAVVVWTTLRALSFGMHLIVWSLVVWLVWAGLFAGQMVPNEPELLWVALLGAAVTIFVQIWRD